MTSRTRRSRSLIRDASLFETHCDEIAVAHRDPPELHRDRVVKDGVRPIADTKRLVVPYERVSCRAGTCHAKTSSRTRWSRSMERRSALTRGWSATTTSVTTNGRPGTTAGVARGRTNLQPCFLRAGRGRRVPRRQETRPRSRSERHAARNRPRLEPDEILKRGADPAGRLVRPSSSHVCDPSREVLATLSRGTRGGLAAMKSEIPDGKWIPVS